MKNFLLRTGAVALALGLISANADAITHTVTINAAVQPGCTSAAAPTGSAFSSITAGSSTFATTVSGTTQAPAAGTLNFGNITCTTTGVKVTLASLRSGLFIDGQQSTAGAKKMNYLATAKVNNNQVAQLATSQGTGSTSGQRLLITGTNSIAIDITFPTDSTLLPEGALTAGTYSDTLTINIDGIAI